MSRQLVWTETFTRTARRFLRTRRDLAPGVASVLSRLEADPFDPVLKTHPLRGQLEGLHAVRVTYDVRLVVKIEADRLTITMIDIGSHDDVYR